MYIGEYNIRSQFIKSQKLQHSMAVDYPSCDVRPRSLANLRLPVTCVTRVRDVTEMIGVDRGHALPAAFTWCWKLLLHFLPSSLPHLLEEDQF